MKNEDVTPGTFSFINPIWSQRDPCCGLPCHLYSCQYAFHINIFLPLSLMARQEKTNKIIDFIQFMAGVVDRPNGATHVRPKGATYKWPF
jgi:hypothetical protein